MCVIASVPATKNIDNKTLDQMWKRNPDGGGIAWIDENGKVQVYKTMKLKNFKQKFKEVVAKYGKSDILVHMRIATHGSVCIDNNHPFHIDPNTVFAHNGIMPTEFHPPAKSDMSDTRYFNQVFLQNVKPTAFDDEQFRTALGDIIGFNKLVILSANKRLKKESYIINEHMGSWEKGVWYSNTHHTPYKRHTSTIGSTTIQPRLLDTTEDACFINEDTGDIWYEENHDIIYSEFIPENMLDDVELQDKVTVMLENSVMDYYTLDDLIIDYALVFVPETKSFQCEECGAEVDDKLKRACNKECECQYLQEMTRR